MSRFGFGHFPTVSVEDPYVPEPVTFLLTLLRKQCKNNCSVPGLVNVNMNTVNAFRRKNISIEWLDSCDENSDTEDGDEDSDEHDIESVRTKRSFMTRRRRPEAPPPYDSPTHSWHFRNYNNKSKNHLGKYFRY